MNRFKELLKAQLIDEEGYPSMDNVNFINWPKTTCGEEEEEGYLEPADCENFVLVSLTDDKFVMLAGGDWQDPVVMTVELVDDKLTVTSSEILHDEYRESMDDEEFVKLLNS